MDALEQADHSAGKNDALSIMRRAQKASAAAVVTAQANADSAKLALDNAQAAYDAVDPVDNATEAQALADAQKAASAANAALADAQAILA